MPIISSLLLEHFARLAADVTGTSAAVVNVLGRRSDRGPTLAAFGMSPGQMAGIARIASILGDGPRLTVVPDIREDGRFDAGHPPAGQCEMRFIAHLKLISSGDEYIGFICVLDATPRPELTPAQLASLGHIADIVIADRRREQRHLHLMHVADRALRVDRMLRLVSEAASCADALTNLLEELCQFHDAAAGRIWQLVHPDEPIHEISRYDEDGRVDYESGSVKPRAELRAATADAIRRNEPHTIRYPGPESYLRAVGAPVPSLFSQVCIPIWVQQQRFGISLAFITARADLEAVMGDIASLADTIRPALFRKVTEERIRFIAHHDELTQLPNRLMFQERLDSALAATQAVGDGFALLCLDLDGFKRVNDTRGHEIGDNLLIAVAHRLRDSIREGDTVARMGGDEFAIVQSAGSQPVAAIALAERLLETFSRPFLLDGRPSMVGVSIGIALYPKDGETPDILLRNADAALYRAKGAGRNTFRLFDPEVQLHQQERLLIEQELREAVEGRQFTLAYQPVCDSMSLGIVGFEALLRWSHPSRGTIPPSQFIPLAEESGLIVPLGQWALEAACAEAANWDSPVCLSVNLSPLQFRQPDLPEQIADILKRTGLSAARLDLEVTEGLLLDESDVVLRTMRALQRQGIRITLDDFGTAYASLSYLRRFPFDRIKIDQSFIRGLCNDDSTQAIVEAILSLGDRLNLSVVAEGVETESELDALRKLGCRLIQGYLPGAAIPSQGVRALLHQACHPETANGSVAAEDGETNHRPAGAGTASRDGVRRTTFGGAPITVGCNTR